MKVENLAVTICGWWRRRDGLCTAVVAKGLQCVKGGVDGLKLARAIEKDR